MTKPQLSTEHYLARIRAFYKKHGRAPGCYETGQYTNGILVKRLGSWRKVLEVALGKDVIHVAPTADQALALLKERYKKLGRLPLESEFQYTKRLGRLLSGMNEALMLAVGRNYTTEVLAALHELTPPGCDMASTKEIHELLHGRLPLTAYQVRARLMGDARAGLVRMRRLSRTIGWSLTDAGRKLVESK